MIFHRHVPAPPLDGYVDHLWFFEGLEAAHRVENVVPDGTFELIIDLKDEPRRVFQRDDPARPHVFRRGWISGAHSGYIVIDVLAGASMIGAHFKPGGASRILGAPADEWADQVVELESMWGSEAARWRERLLEARGGPAKLRLLESLLLRRWQRTAEGRVHLLRVNQVMRRLEGDAAAPVGIGVLADELGVSHKHLIDEFRRTVGLTPKVYGRIQRFQGVLRRIQTRKHVEWADVACACGYYDQSHFVNDFKKFSGFNPSRFLDQGVDDPRFIPADVPR